MRSNTRGRYLQIVEGDWGKWNRRGNRLQCCDCCLVHIIDFRIVGRRNVIEARYSIDKKSTDRIRKRNGISITRKKKK